LGKSLYEDKFKHTIQSAGTAQQLYNAAVERKKQLHREMVKISRKLWLKYFGGKQAPSDSLQMVRMMIDTLSSKHAQPEDFQNAIAREIPKLVSFIRSKNLLDLDDSQPLVIRKEPAYMAGVAGASVTSPGPYDKTNMFYRYYVYTKPYRDITRNWFMLIRRRALLNLFLVMAPPLKAGPFMQNR